MENIQIDYRKKIENIIGKPDYKQWENVSDIYVKLFLANENKRKIVLIWADVPHTAGRKTAVRNFFADVGIADFQIVYLDFSDRKNYEKQWKKIKKRYVNQGNNGPLLVSYADLPVDPVNVIKRKFGITRRRKVIRDIRRHTETLTLSYHSFKGNEIADYAKKHKEDFIRVIGTFADQQSKDTFLEILRASFENDVYKLPEGDMAEKYWECYKHLDDEIWLNCGAATGDTICKFIKAGYLYDRIYAYEGEPGVYQLLENNLGQLPRKYKNRIRLKNSFIGLDKGSGNIDEVFADKKITLINMDIEGAEMAVLKGGIRTFKRCRTVLAVCAYHKPSDLIDIPDFIRNNLADYKIYLRKYRTNSPIWLAEYVYYCVPEERTL